MVDSKAKASGQPVGDLMDEEKVTTTENRWLGLVLAVLLSMFIIVVVTAGVYSMAPPSNAEVIDPATVNISGEFVENNLGTVIESDGSATVRMVAEQYSFVPGCVLVPKGRKVRFRVTSPDVVHGFVVYGTNVNTMVVPGYVSQLYTLFPEEGERNMPCHEYCGIGHQAMWAKVKIIDPKNWPSESKRASCDKKS